MRSMLRRHGLEIARDYTVIEVPFPAMRPVLTEKKADLISAVPPFSLDPGLRAAARTLFTQRDAFGTTQLTAWTARAGFLKQHRAAMVDLMEDVLRALRWYADPANHTAAVEIVAGLMKQPAERFDWVFTKRDQYRDLSGIPNLAALQQNLDQQEEVGLLNAHIDIAKYADLSVVEEAGKRLR
jgi:NitT/TauT family transport system substrate-binding protein